MELAESVGLIGPASRTHDLHAAIQRFHDLICANATVKAAQMAAEVIRETTPPAQPAVPEGWKLVPVEPTNAMVEAYDQARYNDDIRVEANNVWASMVNAASPAQPAPVQEPVAWINAKGDMTYLHGPYNSDDRPLIYGDTTPPAAPVREFGLTWERFNALESEMATLQAEWQAALKEIERLKAAAPVAVVTGYHGGNCVVLPTDPARVFNTGTAFYTTQPAQPAPVQEPVARFAPRSKA
jgi:hypothetical protein